jgi:ankyrin repeat protein
MAVEVQRGCRRQKKSPPHFTKKRRGAPPSAACVGQPKRARSVYNRFVPERFGGPMQEVAPNPMSAMRLDLALMRSIMDEDAEGAARALREGASPQARLQGSTAMALAARQGCERMLEAFSKHGVRWDLSDNLGVYPLASAARSGRSQGVRWLLNFGAQANARDFRGATALAWAAQAPRTEALLCLISAGADVNLADDKGLTPLMRAARESVENTRVLLDSGADLHARDMSGRDALSHAAGAGKAACVIELCKAGADLNAKCSKGMTAAMWATQVSGAACDAIVACVQALSEAGADFEAVAHDGRTALQFCWEINRDSPVGAAIERALEAQALRECSKAGSIRQEKARL